LIIVGVITMLVGIPTGIAMMTIDWSEMAGVLVVMWLAFVPIWLGLLFGYLGRRPSQEVVIEGVIEEEEEEEEEEERKGRRVRKQVSSLAVSFKNGPVKS
jgi:hypothetical protein